jgi:hypothetical protein
MDFEFSDEQKQFMAEVMEDPKALRWLAKFRPEGVEGFFASYWVFRMCWINFGQFQIHHRNSQLTQHIEEAEKVLYFIQQKKLFDLQCLWRAETVLVPEVRFGAEFAVLALDIQTLDFLPPITDEEFGILKDFLETAEWDWGKATCEGWQNHWMFIIDQKAYPEKGFPKFYSYFDERKGEESVWTMLPDLRAPKEARYSDAANEYCDSKDDDAEADADPRPHLMDNIDSIGEFAKLYEDRFTNDCREAMEWSAENRDQALELALQELKDSKERLPIQAHDDWRIAVMRTADVLKRRRISAALDHAYDNYKFRIQNNIGFAPSERTMEENLLIQRTEKWGEIILVGREYLGEPKNFEF